MDTLGKNEVQNWVVRSFCSWTVNGCIHKEFLIGVLRIIRGKIKRSVLVRKSYGIIGKKSDGSQTARLWVSEVSLDNRTESLINFAAFFWTGFRRRSIIRKIVTQICGQCQSSRLIEGTQRVYTFEGGSYFILTFAWCSKWFSRYLINITLKSWILHFSNLSISFFIIWDILSKFSWPLSTFDSH